LSFCGKEKGSGLRREKKRRSHLFLFSTEGVGSSQRRSQEGKGERVHRFLHRRGKKGAGDSVKRGREGGGGENWLFLPFFVRGKKAAIHRAPERGERREKALTIFSSSAKRGRVRDFLHQTEGGGGKGGESFLLAPAPSKKRGKKNPKAPSPREEKEKRNYQSLLTRKKKERKKEKKKGGILFLIERPRKRKKKKKKGRSSLFAPRGKKEKKKEISFHRPTESPRLDFLYFGARRDLKLLLEKGGKSFLPGRRKEEHQLMRGEWKGIRGPLKGRRKRREVHPFLPFLLTYQKKWKK